MKYSSKRFVVVFLLVGLGGAEYLWLQYGQRAVPVPTVKPAPIAALPSAVEAAAPAKPVIHHPVEALQSSVAGPVTLPTLGNSDGFAKNALIDLLGRKAVLSFLAVDDFVRHVVVTVDNLARGQAASRLWPVLPTPGRTLVVERGDGTYLADGNAERYTPFIRFGTSVDTAKATALYLRLYPLFQQAYEELGYPGKYFNDRLVEVIDQLLETPELTGPVKLTLTDVHGSIPITRPWLRYEFADPSLESRPAGQKILLRMGSANARMIKAKLAEFRERITTRGADR
ncbi:MAG: DUF3014 domain-containing protein [Rhodoferax sp.]|uniref:DUF3014 domain-containing protein n=1 Tax=Rhodoferax sp. TaxID=50421 RepID=UPI002603BC0E|nr:DUF3014 domain-containing protein [Rhodoferax sp.]MDD5334136.1 DUF3014 domain-containing protein [Rhodoferax sp.]